MKLKNSRLLTILPYIGLLLTLILSTWTFLRSEQYRNYTETILSQTYEIQWRVSQVRERLVRVSSYIRLASETGKLDPDIGRQIILLKTNIKQLLALPYVDHFLPKPDLALLDHVSRVFEQKIDTAVASRSNYPQALGYMAGLEQEIFEVSSAALDHSAALQQTADINIGATRNWFIFAIALGLVAIFYLIIYQRYVFISRRNQFLRSFASLFAHMTRSRVTALRLFLANTSVARPKDELLKTARNTASELEAINDGLLTIAHSERNLRSEPLDRVLRNVVKGRKDLVKLEIDDKTTQLPVPETQFQVLLEELIQNAETAIKGRRNPKITIRTALKRRYLVGRSDLVVEVEDNGAGIPPEILEKVLIPFFSTKAGKHLGLGLTSCSEMISTHGGKLTIDSEPDRGTIVQIRIPVPYGASKALWEYGRA